MKKIRLAAAALACALLFCGCTQTELDTPVDMKLASVEEADYYLYVPNDWVVANQTGITAAYASLTDNSNVSCCKYIIADNEDRSTIFTISDPVTSEDGSEVADGIVYAKRYWNIYETDLKNTIGDYKAVGEPQNVDLDGCAAVKFTYTSTLSGTSYKHSMVVCCPSPSASSVYLITYTATADNYDTNSDNFSKVIRNFKFQTGVLE